MTKLMRLLALGVAAVLAGPLSAPAEAATFKLITTDLTPQLVPNSVMDLAVTLGYFKREGVDVELVRVQQTPSAIAALMAGQGDMANIAVDSALQLVARNQMKIKAVLSPDKSLPYLVAAKNAITTVKGTPRQELRHWPSRQPRSHPHDDGDAQERYGPRQGAVRRGRPAR